MHYIPEGKNGNDYVKFLYLGQFKFYMTRHDKIWKGNTTNAMIGLKYFLLQLKDCTFVGDLLSLGHERW